MMKLRSMIGSVIALTLGFGGVAHAAGDYFAPERMHCKADSANKITCSDFNRQILVEAGHSADLPTGTQDVFNFHSGVAYYDEGQNAWRVFFTYKNSTMKNMRLKTVNETIKPDFENGSWKKLNDYYTCSTGYMSCPVTNLPAKS